MARITQADRVYDHLKNKGGLTQLKATEEYGITRLGAVIYDLRHKRGCIIIDVERNEPNRYGELTRFVEYRLVG